MDTAIILEESSPGHRLLRSASAFLTVLQGEELASEANSEWSFRFVRGDEGARRSGFYVSLENHTIGRVDRGRKPPSWISAGDVALLKGTTMLLGERSRR